MTILVKTHTGPDLRDEIKRIIARCSFQDITRIDDSTWLATDLYIDSIILMDIVCETESAFDIRINDGDIDGVHQVYDYYLMVVSKLAQH